MDKMSTAFVVRFTWESFSKNWRIQFTPVNGDDPRLFCDAESLFFHIDRLMLTEMKQTTHDSPKDQENI